MKNFLLFVAAAMLVGSANAQSLRFYDQEGNLYDDGAVITTYEVESEFMNNTWHMNIKNTSDKLINVQIDVVMEEINGFFQFCGNGGVTTSMCYPIMAVGTTSYGPYAAAAGSADYYYHAAMMIMDENSAARAKFVAYDANNPDDKTTLTVIFNKEAYDKGCASVGSVVAASKVNVFQRGANLVCNYNFETAANRSIVVSSIVGARVADVALDGNNGEAVINRLPKGVYVYTLVENGRNVKSHKIVVR